MATHQIPQDRWSDYLASFSAHNQTRPVTIDLESAELGSQTLAEHRPLLAAEPDLKDEHEPTITVVLGDPEGGEPSVMRHQVMDPKMIWVKEDDEGRVEALDIEMADGRTIIRFV